MIKIFTNGRIDFSVRHWHVIPLTAIKNCKLHSSCSLSRFKKFPSVIFDILLRPVFDSFVKMSSSKINITQLLQKLNWPIKQHTYVEKLKLSLKDHSIVKAFNLHTLARKGAATYIKRRSPEAQHAQTIVEKLFDLEFFTINFSCGPYDVKHFNLAEPEPLQDLLFAFGKAGDDIWKKIINGEQDRVKLIHLCRTQHIAVQAWRNSNIIARHRHPNEDQIKQLHELVEFVARYCPNILKMQLCTQIRVLEKERIQVLFDGHMSTEFTIRSFIFHT